jgi:transposase
MYKSTLQNLFCLDGLLIDKCACFNDKIVLNVRSPRTQALCPQCGASTKRVHRRSHRTIKHMMHDDKVAYLNLAVRNFKCWQCWFVFREHIPGIDRRRTTAHFRQSVIPKIKDRSFRAVAMEHGMSTTSLVRSATELSRQVGLQWPTKPFALGIDGHSFSGNDMATTLTDVKGRKLIGILPDYKQDTLEYCIENIPKTSKKLITSVCIDMHEASRTVIEKELPNIPIVIDKFHVVQLLNKNLEQMRNIYTNHHDAIPKKLLERNKEDLDYAEKQILKRVLTSSSALNDMWRLKEWFREFYKLRNPKKAKDRYTAMLEGLIQEARPRWRTLYRTLSRWREYILNYFTYRITNAYTEGVHTRIKLLKRISYGFRNKQNYIAKMTLAFLPVSILLHYLNSSPSLT